jgi:hypothetical protein
VEEVDLVVGVVEEREAVQIAPERELGRTKTRPVGGTIIAKEGTIKKWLGLVLVLQLDICHCF